MKSKKATSFSWNGKRYFSIWFYFIWTLQIK